MIPQQSKIMAKSVMQQWFLTLTRSAKDMAFLGIESLPNIFTSHEVWQYRSVILNSQLVVLTARAEYSHQQINEFQIICHL